MRHAARTDATQGEIVKALRACGCAVYVAKLPLDLLVCCRGETLLVEVKEEGGRLTKVQEAFLETWPGKILIVRGPEDAVRQVLGADAMR
jgi:hypothetical protein